jgi:hypothetical protein
VNCRNTSPNALVVRLELAVDSPTIRLDGCAWLEVNVEGAEFNCPLRDSSSSILVPQDVTERVVGNDGDRLLLEVVS